MKNDDVILKLRDYYKENCEKLVFVGEKKLSTNNNCKMYYLDISKSEEQKNYKKLFQEYLLFYIRNRDQLSSIKVLNDALSSEQLSSALLYHGKKIHENKGLYPNSDIERSGLYGELFDDFYLNIVKNEEVISLYTLRAGFNIPNAKGVDLVSATVEEDNLKLIFSEAKFVSSISSASQALVEDIIGNDTQIGHITGSYINDYSSFLLNKTHSIYLDKNNKKVILGSLLELNNLILNDDCTPIEAINKLNIKIRFDFFAIFHHNNKTIEQNKEYFLKIVDNFNSSILETGINNYDIEVIFIPTNNTSMDIKRKLELWD